MLWESSQDELVKLCVEFRKAVVAAFEENPQLAQQVMGAYTPAELQDFQLWSAEAMEESSELKAQAAMSEIPNPAIEARLDRIVLDMSEQSAKVALRALGKETLQGFIEDPAGRTQETSEAFAARKCPNLALVFAP